MVKLAAAECYAVHNNVDGWGPVNRDLFLIEIGTCRTALRLAGPPSRYFPLIDMDLDRMRIREESINNIRNFIDNINFIL